MNPYTAPDLIALMRPHDDPDRREPIDLNGLDLVCKDHPHGAALLAVGRVLIARGARICLVERERRMEHGSIMIDYWWLQGDLPEWFICLLRADDLIEACVCTTRPEPYLAFFKQDLGGPDSVITYFDKHFDEPGTTLVWFHMPASDPTAPDLILRFYLAAGNPAVDH